MRIIFLFFLCVQILACNQTTKDTTSHHITIAIDSLLKKVHQFNGVILIKKADNTIFSSAIGYADIEQKIPLKTSNQFVIGSISKQITAVLIMKEFENGNLKLDDTIADYLANINANWANKITIHHLLTHTHGIEELDQALQFEPGSRFSYSQLGYELLAQILEQIKQRSFEDIAMSFFKKHGLVNSFHPNDKSYKNLVKGHIEQADQSIMLANNSLQNYAAAGSFISNATDLNLWNTKLHGGQLLQASSLQLMKTRYATRAHPIFDEVEYGYGLLFNKGEADIQIGALGYAPGFVSACYYFPQKDINVIVLENVARNLNDFRQTFQVHNEILAIVKAH